MTHKQLQQYDIFLDENDWDIYYWVTQEPTPTSAEYAEGAGPDLATPTAQGQGKGPNLVDVRAREPGTGEWAQTIGTFKPAYRPVPKRWKNSEILSLLRKHVKDRSAGGVHEGNAARVEEQGLEHKSTGGGGLGFMPELRTFDQ